MPLVRNARMLRRVSRALRLVTVMCVLVAAAAAMAQTRPVLRGASYPWEPYEFLTSEPGAPHVVTGFDVELIREILEPLGFEVEFHQMPARFGHLEAVATGSIDFTTSPFVAERARYGLFSDPIRTETILLYMR